MIEFSTNDLGPALIAKAKAALDRHPDATVVRSPHSAATQISIGPAVVAAGRQNDLVVIGARARRETSISSARDSVSR